MSRKGKCWDNVMAEAWSTAILRRSSKHDHLLLPSVNPRLKSQKVNAARQRSPPGVLGDPDAGVQPGRQQSEVPVSHLAAGLRLGMRVSQKWIGTVRWTVRTHACILIESKLPLAHFLATETPFEGAPPAMPVAARRGHRKARTLAHPTPGCSGLAAFVRTFHRTARIPCLGGHAFPDGQRQLLRKLQ